MGLVLIVSQWMGALSGLAVGILGIALLIPGEQPDKFLQGVVDFLTKFSLK